MLLAAWAKDGSLVRLVRGYTHAQNNMNTSRRQGVRPSSCCVLGIAMDVAALIGQKSFLEWCVDSANSKLPTTYECHGGGGNQVREER
jgi:hypothetical protein